MKSPTGSAEAASEVVLETLGLMLWRAHETQAECERRVSKAEQELAAARTELAGSATHLVALREEVHKLGIEPSLALSHYEKWRTGGRSEAKLD